MPDILIYADEGAGPRSLRLLNQSLKELSLPEQYQIKKVNRKTMRDEPWESNASLVIFPGGRDIPYHEGLKGEANRRIRRFVENGGAYLGFCAGAYYGSAMVEFEKGTPNEVIQERELGFYPGSAIGSIYGVGQFSYQEESGCRLAKLSLMESQESCSVYFNGGCGFPNAEDYPQIDILAKYSDIEGEPAAIIHCPIGKGSALLCGVHPEYPVKYLNLPDPSLQEILPALQKEEEKRKMLFAMLFTKIFGNVLT